MLWQHVHASQPTIVAPYVLEAAVSQDSHKCS
jgi:hypothetical protein